jgi:hypothetical protein
MPQYEIKVTQRPDIKGVSFSESDLHEIGEYAVQAIKDRNALGVDIFDHSAKPLSDRYRKRKEKLGRPGIRDVRLTGNMLGSLQVTEASAGHVVISVKGSTPYRKGIFNQNIDPWFGLSPEDEHRILSEKIEPSFGRLVERLNTK